MTTETDVHPRDAFVAQRNRYAAARLRVPFRFKPLSFKGFLVGTTAYLSPQGPNGPITMAYLARSV